jgi:hypothetical protein
VQHRDASAQHDGTIAQSTTWVTTRECDKDSNIGRIINSAIRENVRTVKVKKGPARDEPVADQKASE